jgi:pimeloyl-ACP methyl ester carboxylesterase
MASKKLFFVVPGVRGTQRKWQPLLSRLKEDPALSEGQEVKWVFWPHGIHRWSFGSARRVAGDLRATIKAHDEKKEPFDEIVLVGHSLGAILIRDAYLLEANAHKLDESGNPVDAEPGNWAARVRRIILFASVCRGFNPEANLTLRLGVAIARLCGFYGLMVVSDIQQGAAYITNLRLAWIRYFRRLSDARADPTVIQLLGTADTLVRRADSEDLEQFPNGTVVDIPGESHDTLYRIDLAKDPDLIYPLIRRVFTREYRSATAGDTTQFPEQKIVFVLHGIRASNLGWVDETAEIIRAKYPGTIVRTPTYGFLSALHFFLPWMRRTKARWFQDQYGDLAAKFPDGNFFFIGHSNATYMLGQSLSKIPMIRFVRAYMAGSVLPSGFDWSQCFQRRQLWALRSDRSAADLPVGLLCSALSFMGDIGTGGFAGFRTAPIGLREGRYYLGGHSKPLEDRRNLERIVDEVMTGTVQDPVGPVGLPNPWLVRLSHALKYLGPVILTAILGCGVWEIYQHWQTLSLSGWITWAAVAFLIGVLLLSF